MGRCSEGEERAYGTVTCFHLFSARTLRTVLSWPAQSRGLEDPSEGPSAPCLRKGVVSAPPMHGFSGELTFLLKEKKKRNVMCIYICVGFKDSIVHDVSIAPYFSLCIITVNSLASVLCCRW